MELRKQAKKNPEEILKMLSSLFGMGGDPQPDGPGRDQFEAYDKKMSRSIRPNPVEAFRRNIRPINEPDLPRKKYDSPKKLVYGIGEDRLADPTPVDESNYKELTREDVVNMMRKILRESNAQ